MFTCSKLRIETLQESVKHAKGSNEDTRTSDERRYCYGVFIVN